VRTFDRFADWVAEIAASAYFFGFCVGLVVAWVPTMWIMDINTSQLVINTATTIITFLLVALLHNSQHRFEQAVNLRLQTLLEHHPSADDVVADPGQIAEAPGPD
jgi:low affinity Fe/Cu permease